ncbi:RHS repeat protein [Pseudoduganella violacea]|uniref:YD repeat-containing protein n=1 Tax=Pseudoduganella violacea TaxID=1715466 RepID=A0A7W5BGC1_9BURK|nr:RHS repeat protein [Pseudoduganella violacea]MBB3122463.1 YD repeat-containing protein [Pseudoduganella violacea]
MKMCLSSPVMCGALLCLLSASATSQIQNTTTQYSYDQVGNVVQVIDPLGRATKYTYDQLRRQTKVVDAKNGVTEIGYDGQDRISQVSDARRLQTSFAIDGLGNLIQQISPDTGKTVLTYDESSNVKTRTDAKGQVTRYRYDELDRVVEVSYSDGTAAIYVYDQGENGLGHLTQIRDISGSTQYSYDLHGRVVREAREIDGKVYVTGYRYDGAGRLAGLDYPSGRSVDYLRDPIGNINEIRTGKDGKIEVLASAVLYTPVGAVQSFIFGNGQRYARTYDIDGRVTSYTLNGEPQIVSYDAASRITGIAAPQKADTAVSYGYDELHRLTSELRSTNSLAYSYDAVGNRVRYLNGAATVTYSCGGQEISDTTIGSRTAIFRS